MRLRLASFPLIFCCEKGKGNLEKKKLILFHSNTRYNKNDKTYKVPYNSMREAGNRLSPFLILNGKERKNIAK